MRAVKLALIATAAVAALSSTAYAADLMVETPAPAPVIDNSFNWDGFYIGAFIQGQDVPETFGLGVDLGVNALMDNFVLGGEISGAWLSDDSWTGQVTGRIGVLLSDPVMLYAFSGIGAHSDNDAFVPLGAGIEFGVSNDMSIKAEYQHNFDLDTSAEDANVFKVGLNWHF